jgi:hypothetical protein
MSILGIIRQFAIGFRDESVVLMGFSFEEVTPKSIA